MVCYAEPVTAVDWGDSCLSHMACRADFRWGFVQPGKLEPVGHDTSDSIRGAVNAYGSVLAACGKGHGDACTSIGSLLRERFDVEVRYSAPWLS